MELSLLFHMPPIQEFTFLAVNQFLESFSSSIQRYFEPLNRFCSSMARLKGTDPTNLVPGFLNNHSHKVLSENFKKGCFFSKI